MLLKILFYIGHNSSLKILRECEKVKSEVTWYRTMLSHLFVKFAFSIQIRIDRIVDIIKNVR